MTLVSRHLINVISPALPDCLTGIEFVFKELGWPFKKESTGFEFTIKLD